MLVRLHLDTIHVSTVSLVGFFQVSAGECRREYMARAPKRKRVQSPHWSRQGVQKALVNVCRQRSKGLRRMQEELHLIWRFPVRVRAVPSRHGSSTGRASDSRSRVLFLQPLSPQFRARMGVDRDVGDGIQRNCAGKRGAGQSLDQGRTARRRRAEAQLLNAAQLPFVFKWIAAMPDVHWGIGATVGSVIPTKGAGNRTVSSSIKLAIKHSFRHRR
jgi:hypothetical protein